MSATPDFKEYWNSALADVISQLAGAKAACRDQRVAMQRKTMSLGEIEKHLAPVDPIVAPPDSRDDETGQGHLIDRHEDVQQHALQWLQTELKHLVKGLHNAAALGRDNLRVLSGTTEDLQGHFGTITQGWDTLVSLKQKLLAPDEALQARRNWYVSAFADVERSLRESICRAVSFLGTTEPVKAATVQTIEHLGVLLNPESVLSGQRSSAIAANALAKRLSEGLDVTLEAADFFGNAIGVRDLAKSVWNNGFCKKFSTLGAQKTAILRSLVQIRHRSLHESGEHGTPPAASAEAFFELPTDSLREHAELLYGHGISYSLGVMDAVSRRLEPSPKDVTIARHKAAGELHVANMQLLQERLYWLAWSTAEFVNEAYEDPTRLMLRFNAGFARKKLGYFDPKEIRDIDVSEAAPRYVILRKCLLGDFNGMKKEIERALVSRDMTPEEFSWPALEDLHERKELPTVLDRFERGRVGSRKKRSKARP
ncbi:MAG: hypothetical protein ABI779_17220 [Acidobacteriota bacterium]